MWKRSAEEWRALAKAKRVLLQHTPWAQAPKPPPTTFNLVIFLNRVVQNRHLPAQASAAWTPSRFST
jgi:hypothetical protein